MNENNLTLLDDFIYVLEMNQRRKSTVACYKIDLQKFIEYIGDVDVTKVTVRIADQWLKSLVGKDGAPIKQATRNRKIASLRQFYSYLLRNGHIERDILIDLKPQQVKDKAKKDFLEDAEIRQLEKVLIKNAKNPEETSKGRQNSVRMNALRDKALYLLMLHSGMRVGEVTNLEMDEIIQYEDGSVEIFVPVEKDKAKRGKYIPIDPKLLTYINEYRNNLTFKPNNNYVFLSQNGRQMDRGVVGGRLDYFIKKAGIDKHITNHCTRHSYATSMASNGTMNVLELAQALGHSDTKMLQETYFHRNENTRRKFSKVR